jgi:putative 2-oxoglutarate-Fe(II)-dependent oxygenase superfamily protein
MPGAASSLGALEPIGLKAVALDELGDRDGDRRSVDLDRFLRQRAIARPLAGFAGMATSRHAKGRPEMRYFEPRPGTMILFPWYFYHSTVPFAVSQTRISVAFDATPVP